MASTTSCTTTTTSAVTYNAGVYESKAPNVITTLAQEALKTTTMAHPEVVPEMLTLQWLPYLDPENLSLTETLHLTSSEEIQLQEIFQKWHFSKDIILHSLLGIDLYHDFLALQLAPKTQELVLHSFAPHFFQSFLRFDRDELGDNGSIQQIASKKTICEKLQASKTFVSQVAGATNPMAVNIGRKIDLFLKIFQEKQGKLALSNKKLLCFEDVDMHEYRTIESSLTNIKDLQLYAEFCNAMVASAYKRKFLEEPFGAFKRLAEFCERAHESLDPQVINEMKAYLCDVLQSLGNKKSQHNDGIKKTLQEKDQCLLKLGKKLPSHILENFNQTLEKYSTNEILFANLDFIISEFQTLFDLQVIIPSFPTYSPLIPNMQRFLINIRNCPQSLSKQRKKNAQKEQLPLVANFENFLFEKLSPIESLCRDLIQDSEFQSYQTEEARVFFQNSYQVGYWLSKLSYLREYKDLLPEIKRQLAQVPAELTAFLKTELAKLPSTVSAEERRDMCERVQEACFRKSLFLTRMLMILEDVDTILNNRFSVEPKFIPSELADVIILSELEELFSPKPEEIEEETQAEPSTTPAPANSLPPGVVKGIGLQKPAPKPKAYAPVSSQLKRITKTDKIIQMLKAAGFFVLRESGHTILADEQGRRVPIPRRKEQKPGTVKAIYEQAIAPVQDQKE